MRVFFFFFFKTQYDVQANVLSVNNPYVAFSLKGALKGGLGGNQNDYFTIIQLY